MSFPAELVDRMRNDELDLAFVTMPQRPPAWTSNPQANLNARPPAAQQIQTSCVATPLPTSATSSVTKPTNHSPTRAKQ